MLPHKIAQALVKLKVRTEYPVLRFKYNLTKRSACGIIYCVLIATQQT